MALFYSSTRDCAIKGFVVLEPSSYMDSSGTNLHELLTNTCMKLILKTYHFKHSVKDDQIILEKNCKYQILLILEMVLHVIWYGACVDAK